MKWATRAGDLDLPASGGRSQPSDRAFEVIIDDVQVTHSWGAETHFAVNLRLARTDGMIDQVRSAQAIGVVSVTGLAVGGFPLDGGGPTEGWVLAVTDERITVRIVYDNYGMWREEALRRAARDFSVASITLCGAWPASAEDRSLGSPEVVRQWVTVQDARQEARRRLSEMYLAIAGGLCPDCGIGKPEPPLEEAPASITVVVTCGSPICGSVFEVIGQGAQRLGERSPRADSLVELGFNLGRFVRLAGGGS